jgi:hypothetical protein
MGKPTKCQHTLVVTLEAATRTLAKRQPHNLLFALGRGQDKFPCVVRVVHLDCSAEGVM